MGNEKNFENRLKKWLEAEGVYPLGEAADKMKVSPCGYYEKRWGGGRYVKAGLPDMRITVHGISLEVELKDTTGTPSALQKRNIRQINNSGCIGMVLYPEGFEAFKEMVKVVKSNICNVPIAELRASILALGIVFLWWVHNPGITIAFLNSPPRNGSMYFSSFHPVIF